MLKRIQLCFLFSFLFFMGCVGVVLWSPAAVFAQDLSLGVAQALHIEGTDIPDGSIISATDNVYKLSGEPYDKSMIGVVSEQSALVLEYDNNPGTSPVITSGVAVVRVNDQNGPIKKGDMITSSSVPGVAMRATKSGFILGIAQEDFTPTDAFTDRVIVSLDPKFAFAEDSPQSEQIGKRLLDIITLSNLAVAEQPTVVLRYLLAAIVTLGTFIFTFLLFSRSVLNGIEALGRNPVATSSIMLGMIFNVITSVSILITGLGTAYFITTF